jgi:phosphatidylethanolamine-binding protein (PEBP) family uncharacterized protein
MIHDEGQKGKSGRGSIRQKGMIAGIVITITFLLLASCVQRTGNSTSKTQAVNSTTTAQAGGFTLSIPEDGSNPAVTDGGTLPADYTCDGSSSSPPLIWSGEPAGTEEFCLIVWHIPPDYATNEFSCKYYWIIYNIPATIHSLPKNVGNRVGVLGLNEHGGNEYEPPCSKGPGDKEYKYTLYALLDKPALTVPPAKVTRDVMLAAIKDVTLASTTLRVHNDRTNAK